MPPHSPACARFFKFCNSALGKGIYVIFCLCMKQNANFLHSGVLFFFDQVASINLYKEPSSCFQLSNRSRLVFDIFKKNLIICSQHLDVLMVSNLQFPRPFKIRSIYSPIHIIMQTPCFSRLKVRLFTQQFPKYSKFYCRLNVNALLH